MIRVARQEDGYYVAVLDPDSRWQPQPQKAIGKPIKGGDLLPVISVVMDYDPTLLEFKELLGNPKLTGSE